MAGDPPKSALVSGTKTMPVVNAPPITGDKGAASGLTTDTRVMTEAGVANLPFAITTTADPASLELLRRRQDEDVSLTIADESGITVARKQKAMREKALDASANTVELGCKGSIDISTSTSNPGALKGGQIGDWVCGMDEEIKFREGKYQNQQNEFRLFIEGADVTHYVEGAISWTIESTGGMNSCRFTLNNTQDAFILTPENICAGLNPEGWRASGLATIKPNERYRAKPERTSWRVDETAKFVIYNNKYRAVGPESTTPQIDQETGMWLFPLNPYSCIFNRHDCVRLFIRLPHVSGVMSPTKKVFDLWMPAFTGFIKDYSWDDDPVVGTRYVRVTCYDYRGILERMRVAVSGTGIPSGNSEGGTVMDDWRKPGAAPKPGEPAKAGEDAKGPDGYDFLSKAAKLGEAWAAWFANQKLILPEGTSFKQSSAGGNPYAWAKASQLISAFIQLHQYALAYQIAKRNINDQPVNSGYQSAGTTAGGKAVNPTDPRMQDAMQAANIEMENLVCNAVEGIGQTMALAAKICRDTGVAYNIAMAGAVPGPGAPPKFAVSMAPASRDFQPRYGANKEAYREQERFALVKAYDQYVGARATGSITDKPLEIKGTYKNTHNEKEMVSLPTSVADAVRQYFDITLRYDPNTKAKNPTIYNSSKLQFEALNRICGLFDSLIGAYNKASVGLSSKVVAPVPMLDLTDWNSSWLSPARRATYKGATVDARIANATTQYINNLVASVAKCRKALMDESVKAQPPTSDKLGRAIYYMAKEDFFKKKPDFAKYIPSFSEKIPKSPGSFEAWPLNYTAYQFAKNKRKYEDAIKKAKPSAGGRLVTQLKKVAETTQEMHRTGPSRALASASEVNTIGALVRKYIEFDKAKVGIFGDLIEKLTAGHPHPLAGKNFVEAVNFLCTRNSELSCGQRFNVESYEPSKLDMWNRLVLFGAVQRPITFAEMQEIGESTIRSFESDFSPLKAFYHMLLPAGGMGVQTIVKMHIAGASAAVTEEPTFMTRLQLLNEICESLDYQFFVSGMGDLIFELPVYNSYPDTFGPVFAGSYMISQDWINSSISEENQDVPTAWVVSGSNVDLRLDGALPKGEQGKDHYNKVTIMNTTMVRRLGVKVETIPLKIPGVGGNFDHGNSSPNALQQLAVYAAFYIQRQLAKAHTLSVKYPFRPYVVPNRPLWLIPRQRIGLVTSVTQTMNPPGGACTTDSTIGYVRWMFRDGTFRFVGGGDRQPMDYVGFFSGVANYSPTEGVPSEGPLSLSSIGPRLGNTEATPSDLANRIRASNVFSANVDSAFSEIEPPMSDQLAQQMMLQIMASTMQVNAAIVTAAATGQIPKPGNAGATPVSSSPQQPAPAAGNSTNTAAQKNQQAAAAKAQTARAQNPPIKKPPPVSGTETSYARTGKVDFSGTGFQVHGIQQDNSANKKLNWDLLKSMDVWKYPYGGKGKYNSWGLLYSMRPGNYSLYVEGKSGTHSGTDVMCKEGTNLLAPINFSQVRAKVQIYTKTNNTKNRNPREPFIAQFSSKATAVKFFVYDPVTKKKVLGPDKKPLTRIASTTVTNKFFKGPVDLSLPTSPAYATYYDHFMALAVPGYTNTECGKPYASQGGKYVLVEPSGNGGLYVECYGWFTPPPDRAALLGIKPGVQLETTLVYMHLSRFAEDPNGRGILGADVIAGNPLVPAGGIVGHAGNTGTGPSPHLHVEMYVYPPGAKANPDRAAAFHAVLGANADYLTAQIVAMITGWVPGKSSISPEMLNERADATMKAYVTGVLMTGNMGNANVARVSRAVTVADLVKLMLTDKRIGNLYWQKTQITTSGSGTGKNYRLYLNRVQTNAMFFFKPEQLLDIGGFVGSASGQGSGSGPAAGSPGTARPPLGKSAAYNGTSLQWCSGLLGNGTRTVATAVAKDQQAAAAAGKGTSADPQNKAVEDEKLKQKKEQNNAQLKEAESARAKARSNPEPVRRKFNAFGKKVRRVNGGGSLPGAGVSADTGDKKKK